MVAARSGAREQKASEGEGCPEYGRETMEPHVRSGSWQVFRVEVVSWVTRCGGARDKRACLLMRMLGRLELAGRWNHTAKHIPGIQNTLADGIPRWPKSILEDKVREQTNSSDWYDQTIGTRGSGIFNIVLHTENIHSQHDDLVWSLVMNEAERG